MTEQPQDKPMPDEDALLAPFFAAARAAGEDALPGSLQARVMQDALAQIPAPPAPPAADPGLLASLLAWLGDGFSGFGRQSARLLGGAPGVAVVSAAGLAGVWLGLAVPDPASELLGYIATGVPISADDSSIWAQAARDLGEDEALLALLDSF